MVKENIIELKKENKDIKLIIIGKKGKELLQREFGQDILKIYDFSDVKNVGFVEAEKVSENILSLYKL